METVNIGQIAIEIPASCPDKGAYAAAVKDAFQDYFRTDKARAAFCMSEYDRCQGNPQEFKLSPGARAWDSFVDSVHTRISSENTYEGAAIPGWEMPPLKSQLLPKPEQQLVAHPQERTWRLDQMKVVEPESAKGRGR